MYIIDLPNNAADNLILYADDTPLVTKEVNIIKLSKNILRALFALYGWFTDSGLKLNNHKI